jgi:AraC family transcriptional regulator
MQESNFRTFRKVLGKIETENFEITEAKHLQYYIPAHNHNCISLVCVLSGSFLETFAHKEYICTSQNALFKPVEAVHSNHFQKNGSHTIRIQIKNEQIQKFGKLASLFEDIRLLSSKENLPIIKKIYEEISAPDDLSELALEGLSLELFTNFARQLSNDSTSNDPRWLTRAKDYIHANFNQKLSLSIIAKEVGTHPSHLARVFRQNFNSSIGDYIRNLRLDFAARQIIKTKKSLTEIAAEAGFYDHSHLTNLFKEHFGTTPSNYRTIKR